MRSPLSTPLVKRLTSQAHASATTLRKEEHDRKVLRTLANQRMSKETLTGDDQVREIMVAQPAKTPPTRTQVPQRLVATHCAARGARPLSGPFSGSVGCPTAHAVAACLNV